MKLFAASAAVVAVLLGAATWFVYSGTYNIAATQPHTAFTRWLFTTVRDQSIEEYAGQIKVPPLTDSMLIQTGAHHYDSSCAVCHGAPGRKLSEISKGLNPSPPELHTGEIQRKYTDAELYWIVEHGIRMTGMPAFGPTHKQQDLWAIIAFVKQLPELRPEEYESMVKTGAEHDSATQHHSG